ncbi:SDA1-domain-containing protein [Jaminaea rosea]|uniref:Protein SDA1 n=1 Tax=Jaminaea rosea TaxID=1569628 RepID=A0A316UWM5_9BASI|nr:SDA1-domain-containing protein [Jaminaea rosea]PWN29710.1 SDA1-domain-containing protein [Jaminaea rosea]
MAKGKAGDPPRPSAIVEEGGLRHRSQARGLLNTSNLPALQNLLKRDPDAYTEEFKQQWNHYQSIRAIYAANIGAADAFGPSGSSTAAATGSRLAKEHEDRFRELLAFVTQLVPSYPTITAGFSKDLADLLLKHHASLSPDLRHSAVRSLVLLRNRDVIDSEEMLRTLFPLLSISTSSSLRSLIQSTILSDVKSANLKTKNHRLNRVVQGLLFGVVEQGMKDSTLDSRGRPTAEPKGKSQALWAVRLAADLWRKNIWNDAKTVSLLALACFHPHPKVQTSAVRFFLNDLHHAEDGAEESESDSDDEPVIPDVSKLVHQRKVKKKTRSNDRKVRAAAALAKKRNKDKAAKGDEGAANFAALYLLNDPQTFGEKLFENLSKGDKRHPIEVKVRLMQLLSRVMGAHKLCVLSFYSFIVKYLAPHQHHITLILVSLAQSVHEQTPPDVLTPVLRKISDSFVHPGVGPEVVAAGINSVREIAKRQPWCMEESLLEDLIGYRKSKDKGVAAASRGLLQLYREVNPALLPRKERGKSGSMALQAGEHSGPRGFGVAQTGTQGIQGLDLLEEHYAKRDEEMGSDAEEIDDEEEGWKDWELESDSDDSDDSDSSGGWINVDSEGEDDLDIDYSDSDEEKEEGKEEKTPKEKAAARREKRRQQRRKARAQAEAKANGVELEESSSENGDDKGSDSEDGEDGDARSTATAPSSAAAAAEAAVASEAASMSRLATTRILTPADFAKLNELRLKAAEAAVATGGRAGATAKRELAELQSRKRATQDQGAHEDDLAFIDEYAILGPRKKAKDDKEARLASIAKGREDREKFGSKKGKRDQSKSSSTNEQKAKGKNFAMVKKSWNVRKKGKASLREKSKNLKKHKDTMAKRKGKH